jgi:hypothetical protein
LRLGGDFFHGSSGAWLRGDSGWVGQVENADELRDVLGSEGFGVAPYTLVAGLSGVYLTPVGVEGGPAVHLPLSGEVVAPALSPAGTAGTAGQDAAGTDGAVGGASTSGEGRPAEAPVVEADATLYGAVRHLLPETMPVSADGGASWVEIPASVVREHARAWWVAMGNAPQTTPEALEQVVRETAERVARGEAPVPFLVEEATGGLADPARGGLTFGIEIEFDLPEGLTQPEKEAVYAAIVADLRAAGLTRQAEIGGYHQVVDLGYSEARDWWRLEKDPTVSAELVSPILRDTPRTWADLRKAVGILQRHGGLITKRTSSHVHVGTGQFGDDVRNYEALRALYVGHQDQLFRLGMNPRADAHRGTKESLPLSAQHGGYLAVWDTPSGRDKDALSFRRVQGRGTDHVEFRQLDGSLDVGELQQNVNTALGLVYGALRLAGDPAWQPPAYEEVGANAGVVQGVYRAAGGPDGVTVFEPDAPELSAPVRRMLDTVFWGSAQREQAMARYAVTSWHGGRGARQADDASSGLLDPASMPGLAGLGSLGSVFVTGLPGAALFRSSDRVVDRGEAGLADRMRGMFPGGEAFVGMVAFNRRPFVPHVFGFGGSKRVEPPEFIAMLRHLGWSPGTPLVLVHPFEDTPASLVAWGAELAAELEEPVYIPASGSEYGEDVELPSGRLADLSGVEVFGPPGGAMLDDGELLVLPGTAWFRALPGTTADGAGHDLAWPAATGYARYDTTGGETTTGDTPTIGGETSSDLFTEDGPAVHLPLSGEVAGPQVAPGGAADSIGQIVPDGAAAAGEGTASRAVSPAGEGLSGNGAGQVPGDASSSVVVPAGLAGDAEQELWSEVRRAFRLKGRSVVGADAVALRGALPEGYQALDGSDVVSFRRAGSAIVRKYLSGGLKAVKARAKTGGLVGGAPPALDPIDDWSQVSYLSGKRRSSELRAIDAAVARLPYAPRDRDLQRVLRAITAWKAQKTPQSARWAAVVSLERAVRGLLVDRGGSDPAQLSAGSGAAPSYGSHGQSSGFTSGGGLQAPAPAGIGPRQVTVEGYAPAVGMEVEVHGKRVILPPGDDRREYGDVVTRPGLVKVVFDRVENMPILELVFEKARALAGGRDDGRAERSDILATLSHIMLQLNNAPDGARISRIFQAADGYQVDPLATDLPVKDRLAGAGVVLVHFTAGVALGGATDFLWHVAQNMRQDGRPMQLAYEDALAAIDFSAQAVARYDEWLEDNPAWATHSQVWDRRELEGALALGFTQVAGTMRRYDDGQVGARDYTAVASRVSLAGIRNELGLAPRAFLQNMRGWLHAALVADFNVRVGNRDWMSLPLQVNRVGGIGDYWDNLLLSNPRRVIDQYDALRVRTNFSMLDGNVVNGVPLIQPAVVPLEARAYAHLNSDEHSIGRQYQTISDAAIGSFNEARALRGLPPVGGPISQYSPDQSSAPYLSTSGQSYYTSASPIQYSSYRLEYPSMSQYPSGHGSYGADQYGGQGSSGTGFYGGGRYQGGQGWGFQPPSAPPDLRQATPATSSGYRFDPSSVRGWSHEPVRASVAEPGEKLAEPASRDWRDRRSMAPAVKVLTERLDPKSTFTTSEAKPEGQGWGIQTRAHVQRIQATNGTWVRNHIIALPVRPMPGVTPADVTKLQDDLNHVIDQYVNKGYRLPRSGDQLHAELTLVVDPAHGEAVEIRPGTTKSAPDLPLSEPDTRHWGLEDAVAQLLHEVLHYLGLPDQNLDKKSLFRRNPRSSAVHADGLMAGGLFDPSDEMPQRYLPVIEGTIDSTAVLIDHPLGAESDLAPPSAVTDPYSVVASPDTTPTYPGPSSTPAIPSAMAPTSSYADASQSMNPSAEEGSDEEDGTGRVSPVDAGDLPRHAAVHHAEHQDDATAGQDVSSAAERPTGGRVRWADEEGGALTNQGIASDDLPSPAAADEGAEGIALDDLLDQTRLGRLDDHTVAIWLSGVPQGGPAFDEATVTLLGELVPPQTVFVMGELRSGQIVVDDRPVSPAMLAAAIVALAPGRQPFLLIRGAGEVAGPLADITGGPVLAAPYGVRFDPESGTMIALGSRKGKEPVGEPMPASSGDGAHTGRFWMYLPGEPEGTPIHSALRAAQRAEAARPGPLDWPAMDQAPRFDLVRLLRAAGRDDVDPGRAHESVARRIRQNAGADRPVVLTTDATAMAAQAHMAALRWAVRTMNADLIAIRQADPTTPKPRALERYELQADEVKPIRGSADSIERATADIVRTVNELHARRPDNAAGAPAELPPAVTNLALDPVFVGRDVAYALNAHLRVDVTGPDGTVHRTWIYPDGGMYAFDPGHTRQDRDTRNGTVRVFSPVTSGTHLLTTGVAEAYGLLTPDQRAQADGYGLDQADMGRIYLTAPIRQQTFEQAFTAEIAARGQRLSGIHPDLPRLLRDAVAENAFWQRVAQTRRPQQGADDPLGTWLSLSGRVHEAQWNQEEAARIVEELQGAARSAPGDRTWTPDDVQAIRNRLADLAAARAAAQEHHGESGPPANHGWRTHRPTGTPAGNTARGTSGEPDGPPRPPAAGGLRAGARDTGVHPQVERWPAGSGSAPDAHQVSDAPPTSEKADGMESPAEETPLPPWFVAYGSLGDGEVAKVDTGVTAGASLDEPVATWLDGVTEGLRASVAAEVRRRVIAVLAESDPKTWQRLLLSGKLIKVKGTQVKLSFGVENVVHDPDGTEPPEEGLQVYFSKYGDTTYSEGTVQRRTSATSSWIDRLLFAAQSAWGPMTHLAFSVSISAESENATGTSIAMETQSGNRVIANAMHDYAARIRVRATVNRAPQADLLLPGSARLRFPTVYSSPAERLVPPGEDGGHPMVAVIDPSILQGLDYAVNAVSPETLLSGLRAALRADPRLPRTTVDALVQEAAEEYFNEKTLKDRSQWWLTDSWVSGLIEARVPLRRKFAGHLEVGGLPHMVRYVTTTDKEVLIRNDIADTAMFRDGEEHATGVTVSGEVGMSFEAGELLAMPHVDPVMVKSSRGHTHQVMSEGQAKNAIMRKDRLVRYMTEFTMTVKVKSPTYGDHTYTVPVLGEVGIGRGHAAYFEQHALGGSATGSGVTAPDSSPVPGGRALVEPALPAPRTRRSLSAWLRSKLGGEQPPRPFTRDGVRGPQDLLRLADRRPIEIALPPDLHNGRRPVGAVALDGWLPLHGHLNVAWIYLTPDDSITVSRASAPGGARWRYVVGVDARVTGALLITGGAGGRETLAYAPNPGARPGPALPSGTGDVPVTAGPSGTARSQSTESAMLSAGPVRPDPTDAASQADLDARLRAAGLDTLADFIRDGGTPQVQLTDALGRRLTTGPDDALHAAVDLLKGRPEIQVIQADGTRISPEEGRRTGPAVRVHDGVQGRGRHPRTGRHGGRRARTGVPPEVWTPVVMRLVSPYRTVVRS